MLMSMKHYNLHTFYVQWTSIMAQFIYYLLCNNKATIL